MRITVAGRPASPRVAFLGVLYSVAGVFALFAAAMCVCVAVRDVNRWLHAGRYVAAEFEVTRVGSRVSGRNPARIIEGVIHPGGQPVTATESDLALRRFVDPGDRTGRRPLPVEVEGRRLEVLYWPRPADAECWWHPPAVVMPGATQGGQVVPAVALGLLFAWVAGFCFRRDNRILPRKAPSTTSAGS
jgi:hypothetical protein